MSRMGTRHFDVLSDSLCDPAGVTAVAEPKRKIRPQVRMAVFVLLSVVAVFLSFLMPPPLSMLVQVCAVITVLRTAVMFLAGLRPDFAWNHNERIPAASLLPYVLGAVVIGVLSFMTPGGGLPGILGVVLALCVVAWGVTQYLWGEMTCTRGVWHNKDEWIDWASVDPLTRARWEATDEARRAAKEARRAA